MPGALLRWLPRANAPINLCEKCFAYQTKQFTQAEAWDTGEREVHWPSDTEQKYCAHCDGGISEGPNEGDGSQFTCSECGGFFHRYRLNCHPDKFHDEAEPPPCNHPDYGQEGGDYWVICDKCGKRKWDPTSRQVQAGVGLPEPEPDVVVDPAVAQLQRAVKQAGDRIVGLETYGKEWVAETEKRFAALEHRTVVLTSRIGGLEDDAHTPVENEYSRLAALVCSRLAPLPAMTERGPVGGAS